MARPRASDHEAKREGILSRAAELIARHGYDRASIGMIAEACGMSKGLLYHYYRDKEALLDDIIRCHLERLVEIVREIDAGRGNHRPEIHLGRLVAALLDAYRDADALHRVQINHLDLLPRDRQAALKGLERELVDRFAAALLAANPALGDDPRLIKPATMSLFGMLNWHYLWFRPDGPLDRADYAAIATRIILDGTRALEIPARTSLPQTAS